MAGQQQTVKITESPRDAMQGLKYFVPTESKAAYINSLLKVGFDVIDFGSFVSPKAIPQFSDMEMLLKMLDRGDSETELLSIVGNTKWAGVAAMHSPISWLGFPFSISATFQKMNLNCTLEESLPTISDLLEICDKQNKKLRIYLSMAFGNPYGEPWDVEIAANWVYKLHREGTRHIAISDTVGFATPETIRSLFPLVMGEFHDVTFGFHLHTTRKKLAEKIEAAWESGVKHFDTVLTGAGGCPLSGHELVGNLDTMELLNFLESKGIEHGLNTKMLSEAVLLATEVFDPPKSIENKIV